MYIFQQKLKSIKTKLKCWNKNTFGNIFQEKKELEEKNGGPPTINDQGRA